MAQIRSRSSIGPANAVSSAPKSRSALATLASTGATADAAVATAERDFGALENALAGPTLDLDRIWATLQPHYDGNALAEALDVPKGPLIGGLMAAQREWQLAQPTGDRDACLAYLRSRVEDLRQMHGQGRRGGKSKKARR